LLQVGNPTVVALRGDSAAWDDGCGGGIHRLGGTSPTQDSGSVCEARGGSARDGWTVHAPAVEGERGRCHPGDLCFVHPGFSANLWLSVSRQPVLPEYVGSPPYRRAALEPAIHFRNYLLFLLLCFDRVQPDRGC